MTKKKTPQSSAHEIKGAPVLRLPPEPIPDPTSAGLEGITFADEPDEDPRANDAVATPTEFTAERNAANQAAARKVIERMHWEAPLLEVAPAELPELSEEQAAAIAPRLFLVRETAKVARSGSTYTLPAGKRISNRDYDIDSLREQGVKLEEVAGKA